MLVESYIPGSDYRMLVVNDQSVAIARRIPAHVLGDGVHTIEELVEQVNRDPLRGVGHENVLTRMGLDGVAERLLADKGYRRVPWRSSVTSAACGWRDRSKTELLFAVVTTTCQAVAS